MGLQQHASIYVAHSPTHGKGVFTSATIHVGEIIESCPVIVFSLVQLPHVRRTFLDDYYFDWGDDGEYFALCLGYGSLYNHDYTPNAEYEMDFENETIDIFCIREIAEGEEIFINYNGDPTCQTPVWFEKGLRGKEEEYVLKEEKSAKVSKKTKK
jgi:uncharacterized protein